MPTTGTTQYASAIITEHVPELLETFRGYLVASRFADTRHEMKGRDTVRFNKILQPAKVTSALSEGTPKAAADAKQLQTNYTEASMEEWGDVFGFTSKVDFASWIKQRDSREVIAHQMARSMEYQLLKMLCRFGLWHRVDYDTTYEVTGYPDSGSTTTIVDDALTQPDSFWNGGQTAVFNASGPNYDVARHNSGFVAATDTLTFAAFNHAMTTSSRYHLCVPTGIVAGDKLTTAALIRMRGMHTALQTMPWRGGVYRMFLHAAQHLDLWTDSTFLNSAIYDNSGRFKTYQLGRWFNIEFMVASELYRMDADGTENQATGAVHCAPCFGRGAYSALHWGMPGIDNNIFGIKWKLTSTEDTDRTDLLGQTWFLGWYGIHAKIVKRCTSTIVLLTGATELPTPVST